MKKILALFFVVAAMVFVSLVNVNEVSASSATTKTYTLDSNGKLVATQDAYLPKLTFTGLGLSKPSDLVLDSNDFVYISDTGNNRIVVLNSNTGEIAYEFKQEAITGSSYYSPNGMYVNSKNELYVCYTAAGMIYKYNLSDTGTITYLDHYTENDIQSPLFSNRSFKPMKIAVDTGGNMYVTGEGVNEGIIQLSVEGEFLGYFTTNKVKLSLLDQIRYKFYTDEQLALLPSRDPIAFSNLYADSDGLIYTTTPTSTSTDVVKKHNTAGSNLFTKYKMVASENMEDIWVDSSKNVFAASASGEIYVYTSQGEFIHKFGGGGTADSPDISGVFQKLSAIAVDSQDNIWALDGTKEIIQTFEPTDYALTIYDAIDAYFRSDYEESINLWNEVIKLNQMSNIAHNNIGLNYLSIQEYDLAMHHLEIANNRSDYSTAYWEVRNIWIQNNLTWMFILVACLFVALFILFKFDKKHGFLTPVREVKDKVLNNKYVSNYLFMFTVCRHPEDGYYDLRTEKRGSFTGALMILATVFVTYIIYISSKGFIYQTQALNEIDFISVIFGFYAILGGFIICNYLVTSITEGNGSIKQIFILMMYACGPLIVGLLSIVVLSHFVTLTEAFMLDAILGVSIVFTIFTVLKGMQEIQGYDVKNLTKSLVLTFLFMIILVVVLLILFVLSQDLFNFFELLFKEVFS